MTDYRELIEELREQARLEDEYPEDAVIKRRAAFALEAQAKEIERLNSIIEGAFQSNLQHCRLQDAQFARIAELEADIDRNDEWARGFIEKTDARIAELEAALTPLAEMYYWIEPHHYAHDSIEQCNQLTVAEILAARAALKGEKG
jgi:hypothetical protein